MTTEPRIQRIPLDQIDADPDQPRKVFDRRALEQLAQSIATRGLMQAITVRPAGARFMIVGGERRWRAHKLLVEQGTLKPDVKIKCEIRELDERETELLAIVENLQRADLQPLEEARAFKRMVNKGWLVEDLAKELGTTVFRIEEKLSLLNTDPAVQHLVSTGAISMTTAALMSGLPAHRQTDLVRKISSGAIAPRPNDIRAAIDAIQQIEAQPQLMSMPAPANQEERQAMSRLERKVEQVVLMIGQGFSNGDCVAAKRANPDRLRTLDQQLELCRKHIAVMQRQIQESLAQAEILAA